MRNTNIKLSALVRPTLFGILVNHASAFAIKKNRSFREGIIRHPIAFGLMPTLAIGLAAHLYHRGTDDSLFEPFLVTFLSGISAVDCCNYAHEIHSKESKETQKKCNTALMVIDEFRKSLQLTLKDLEKDSLSIRSMNLVKQNLSGPLIKYTVDSINDGLRSLDVSSIQNKEEYKKQFEDCLAVLCKIRDLASVITCNEIKDWLKDINEARRNAEPNGLLMNVVVEDEIQQREAIRR